MAGLEKAASALGAFTKGIDAYTQNIAEGKNNGNGQFGAHFQNIGGGIKVTRTNDLQTQGSIQESDTNTHVALDSGNGFMVAATSDGSKVLTRDGSWTSDRNGDLVNGGGHKLQGWILDGAGEIPSDVNISSMDGLETINITSVSGTFTETTEARVIVNLSAAEIPTPYQRNLVITDSLGIDHNVFVTYTKTATDNEWKMSITAPDAVVAGITQDGGSNDGVPFTDVLMQFNTDGILQYFNGDPLETTVPKFNINWETSTAKDSNVTLNLGVGENDGTRIMGKKSAHVNVTTNGRSFSAVDGTFISPEGDVYAVFKNGEKSKIAKIAIANVNAPNELNPVNGNAYTITPESGDAALGSAGESGFAAVISGQIETKPVDFARSMLKIISLQQNYNAMVSVTGKQAEMMKKLEQL